MRCPNCHSIIGDRWAYCNYCGQDLTKYHNYTQPFYYREAYEQEKRNAEQMKSLVYMVLLGVSLVLNLIELLVIVITNL